MEKSSAQWKEIETLWDKVPDSPPDLEFPVDPNFVSKPPRLPWDVAFRGCEEALPWHTARPGFEERRLADKVDVEFVL